MATRDSEANGEPAHGRWAENAAAYVRQELSGAEATEYEVHRKNCTECQALEKDLARVIRLLESRPAATVSRDLTDSVMQRISQEERESGGASGSWRIGATFLRVAALAVAVVGLAALIHVWRPGSGVPAVATTAAPGVAAPSVADSAAAGPQTAVATVQRKAEAIDGAMKWLLAAQESTGAWDPVKWGGKKEYEVSLTSMALLAFRRNARSGASAEHAAAAGRAVEYLLAQQKADGSLGPDCSGRMYNHGIACVALLERLKEADDSRVREALGRAVAFIRDQQHESGGWGYEKRAASQANTSISVWQLDALLLARKAGMKDAGGSLARGLNWLRTMVDEQGSFGYQKARDGQSEADTLTAMGTYCLFMADSQMGGQGLVNARIRAALKNMAVQPDSEPDFYRSYFLASALGAGQSREYTTLLADLQRLIIGGRSREPGHTGSWEPVGRWSAVGGRLYTTTMATLSLEEGI